jgi:hypothetical protein
LRPVRVRLDGYVQELFEQRKVMIDEEDIATAGRIHDADLLIGAVFADQFLFDGLRHRIRHDVKDVDARGRAVVREAVAARLFDLENISALFVLLNVICENGGNDVEVGPHGAVADGLPLVPPSSLGQLHRNGLLSVRRCGSGFLVGLGSRITACLDA